MTLRRWVSLGGLFGLLALGAVTLTLRGKAQQPTTLVVQLAPGNIVARIDPVSERRDTIYRSPAWSVRDLTVSPDGRHAAFIEVERAPAQRNRLIVINSAGIVRDTVDRNVQAYEWCCLADEIAILTGAASEVGVGFVPDSAFLYDVTSGAETPLREPSGVPPQGGFYAVHWAPFDSSLYLKTIASTSQGQRVFRYDVSDASLTRTEYRDIHFSPSGRHYLYFALEEVDAPGWHLYDRESGRELELPDPAEGAIRGWVYNEGDYLLLARVEPSGRQTEQVGIGRADVVGFNVYDVTTGSVVQRLEGTPIPEAAVPRGTLALRVADQIALFTTPR